MEKNSSAAGCGLIFVGLLILAAMMWVFKIGIILLGIIFIALGAIGSIVTIPLVWIFYSSGKKYIRDGQEFDATLAEMTLKSASRLSLEMTAWDRIQSNRGLGTSLESMYFNGEVDANTKKLLNEVNELMTEGENLQSQSITNQPSRQHQIRLNDSMDSTWLKLEKRRKSILT